MASIFREDNDTFRQIMECSIAYVRYVDNGGCVCKFTSNMTEQVIDLAMKLKAHRDYIDKYCGREIIKYDENGERKETAIRSKIPKGTHKTNKVRSERENRQGYPLIS